MARKYRSRLAKKESQRMMKQSMMLFVLTGLCVAALVIWGIPALIRMAGFLGEIKSSGDPINATDTIAPYPPQLNVPYEATHSSRINIVGYGETDATIKLFLNDEEISSTLANDASEFMFEDIQLSSGSNQLYVIAEDAANNSSEPSTTINIVYDSAAPEVSIEDPSEGDSFFTTAEQSITVKGTVSEDAQIYVNGRIAFANSDGEYSQQVRLEPGENLITVKAVDPAGNETEESVTVNFSN